MQINLYSLANFFQTTILFGQSTTTTKNIDLFIKGYNEIKKNSAAIIYFLEMFF
jgi:hypothetical protein